MEGRSENIFQNIKVLKIFFRRRKNMEDPKNISKYLILLYFGNIFEKDNYID